VLPPGILGVNFRSIKILVFCIFKEINQKKFLNYRKQENKIFFFFLLLAAKPDILDDLRVYVFTLYLVV